jgi:hypothetical protein
MYFGGVGMENVGIFCCHLEQFSPLCYAAPIKYGNPAINTFSEMRSSMCETYSYITLKFLINQRLEGVTCSPSVIRSESGLNKGPT